MCSPFRKSSWDWSRFSRRGWLVATLASFVLLMMLFAGCGSAGPGAAGFSPISSPAGSDAATATATARPSFVYVAIGASETFGTGADNPSTQNWPTDLRAKLPQGTQVVNLGIPGATAHQALQGELPAALDAQPDLVTVWLGTNDINAAITDGSVTLQSYQQDLDTILTKLDTLPHVHVAVANVPDLTLLPRFYSYNQVQLKRLVHQWNSVIAQEASMHHAILVDIFSRTSDLIAHPDYLSADGLHPSTRGYQQIAAFFYQVLHANGVI